MTKMLSNRTMYLTGVAIKVIIVVLLGLVFGFSGAL